MAIINSAPAGADILSVPLNTNLPLFLNKQTTFYFSKINICIYVCYIYDIGKEKAYFVILTTVGIVDVLIGPELKKLILNSLKNCIENKELVLFAH